MIFLHRQAYGKTEKLKQMNYGKTRGKGLFSSL